MAPATRTQIYLTADQRARLEVAMRREGKSLAQLVREALDAYLVEPAPDGEDALRRTFGSLPEITVPPRDEWDRD